MNEYANMQHLQDLIESGLANILSIKMKLRLYESSVEAYFSTVLKRSH